MLGDQPSRGTVSCTLSRNDSPAPSDPAEGAGPGLIPTARSQVGRHWQVLVSALTAARKSHH